MFYCSPGSEVPEIAPRLIIQSGDCRWIKNKELLFVCVSKFLIAKFLTGNILNNALQLPCEMNCINCAF